MRTLIPLCLFASSLFGATAQYTVRYDGGSRIHVEASLPAADGKLLIAQSGGIDHLPDQWATFVRDLRVVDQTVQPKPAGKEGWLVDAAGPMKLRYDIALDYATGQWPAGNEQSGRLLPDALYTVTKPLFIYTASTTDAIVRFEVGGSKVATPWAVTGTNTFRVDSVPQLINNSVVIGRFPSTHVRVGAFDVTVATPGLPEMPPLLTKALQQIGVVATGLFDKTPPGVYLMTFLHEDAEDGESFDNSAGVTSPDRFDQAGMIVTGNTMVHELLHHWIGGQLEPTEHDSIAWFTEGFTEYYANVAIARSGAVPPDLLLRKFNNQVAGYLYFCESSLFKGVPVASAGQRKGAYRFGVYNAGWAIALSLDVALRTESNGKRSLDDVLRLLYERNGQTHKPLTVEDIRAAVEETGGRSYADFFQKYIADRNELPIAATLAKLGLQLRGQPYAADIYITAGAEPNALRRAMFAF